MEFGFLGLYLDLMIDEKDLEKLFYLWLGFIIVKSYRLKIVKEMVKLRRN